MLEILYHPKEQAKLSRKLSWGIIFLIAIFTVLTQAVFIIFFKNIAQYILNLQIPGVFILSPILLWYLPSVLVIMKIFSHFMMGSELEDEYSDEIGAKVSKELMLGHFIFTILFCLLGFEVDNVVKNFVFAGIIAFNFFTLGLYYPVRFRWLYNKKRSPR